MNTHLEMVGEILKRVNNGMVLRGLLKIIMPYKLIIAKVQDSGQAEQVVVLCGVVHLRLGRLIIRESMDK